MTVGSSVRGILPGENAGVEMEPAPLALSAWQADSLPRTT